MEVNIKRINGGTQQFADVITNAAPLVGRAVDLRDQVDEIIRDNDISSPTADELRDTIAAVEDEMRSPEPKRSRLIGLFSNLKLLTAGMTATAGLVESIDAVVHAVSSIE